MKTEEIKIFKNVTEILDYYSFVSNEKKDEVGHKSFWVPLEGQLKWMSNGLGTITYFEVVNNDLKDRGDERFNSKFLYKMHSEYIKNLEITQGENQSIYLKADGFDDCLIGVGFTFGKFGTLVYDQAKVIEKLKSDGMTEEEAFEYYEYNILGACLGDNMPIFVEKCTIEQVQDLIDMEDQNNDS
jgi:hypothetical protein